MIINEIRLSNNRQEMIEGMTPEFPYSVHYCNMKNYIGHTVPWHWHEEVEFFYILKGTLVYTTNNNRYAVSEGTGGFVNSNVLHTETSVDSSNDVIFTAHKFSTLFLGGFLNSVFEQKYLKPVLNCHTLEFYRFDQNTKEHRLVQALLKKAYDVAKGEELFYEFKLREYFTEIWKTLYLENEELIFSKQPRALADNERIRDMLQFIHTHYTEKILLEDIASVACLSKRECTRCFKKNLQMSPMEYVIQYRILQAAAMLRETDESVVNVGMLNGFCTSSYFGKTFREYFGRTPQEYRKRYAGR